MLSINIFIKRLYATATSLPLKILFHTSATHFESMLSRAAAALGLQVSEVHCFAQLWGVRILHMFLIFSSFFLMEINQPWSFPICNGTITSGTETLEGIEGVWDLLASAMLRPVSTGFQLHPEKQKIVHSLSPTVHEVISVLYSQHVSVWTLSPYTSARNPK